MLSQYIAGGEVQRDEDGAVSPHCRIAAILLRMAEMLHVFIGMQNRGLIALPAGVRKRHRLDEPGAQLEVTEREDGVIELRAHVPVPATQSWFWTARWQRMEREVDGHIADGEVQTHASGEDFVAHLDRLDP